MPVVWTVKPITAEWTSETTREKRTGTTVYLCRASEPSSPAAAETAPGLPGVGTNYPGVVLPAYFPCVGRKAGASDQTRMHFKVTCDYDSSITGLTESPLDAPLKVSYDPESAEESYFVDKSTGTPKYAVMTSGEPFAELPVRDNGQLSITLEKNVAGDVNYSAYESFIKTKVNDAPVTIDGRTYAAGTLKTTAPKLSEVKEQNGIEYRTLVITLKANEDGWDQKFESRGLYGKGDGELTMTSGGDDVSRLHYVNDAGEAVQIEVAWPLSPTGFPRGTAAEAGAEIVLKPYAGAAFTELV